MNKLNSNQTGGIPDFWNDLEFILGQVAYGDDQQATTGGGIYELLTNMLNHYGTDFIISGCRLSGSTISAGFIMLNGVIVAVDSSPKTNDYFSVHNSTDSVGNVQTQLGVSISKYQMARAICDSTSGTLAYNGPRLSGRTITSNIVNILSFNIDNTIANVIINANNPGQGTFTQSVLMNVGLVGDLVSINWTLIDSLHSGNILSIQPGGSQLIEFNLGQDYNRGTVILKCVGGNNWIVLLSTGNTEFINLMLSNEYKDELFKGIYSGAYAPDNIPYFLYAYYALTIQKGFEKGIKKKFDRNVVMAVLAPKKLINEYEDIDLMPSIRRNINLFSGAKCLNELVSAREKLLDKDGSLRSFNDFKIDAEEIHTQYDSWLATEYDTAVKQGVSAYDYLKAQERKEALPYLQYVTVGDDRVREEHEELDGIIKPVDDEFWDEHMPPTDWNCRCVTIQLSEGIVTEDDDMTDEQEYILTGDEKYKSEKTEGLKPLPDLFKMNPAKDKYIFKEKGNSKHPYFKIAQRYDILKGNNFNQPQI